MKQTSGKCVAMHKYELKAGCKCIPIVENVLQVASEAVHWIWRTQDSNGKKYVSFKSQTSFESQTKQSCVVRCCQDRHVSPNRLDWTACSQLHNLECFSCWSEIWLTNYNNSVQQKKYLSDFEPVVWLNSYPTSSNHEFHKIIISGCPGKQEHENYLYQLDLVA